MEKGERGYEKKGKTGGKGLFRSRGQVINHPQRCLIGSGLDSGGTQKTQNCSIRQAKGE